MGALLVPAKKTTAVMRGSLADALRQLSVDMQDKIIRPAVFEGAASLTRELELNVGKLGRKSGTLRGSIYTKYLDRKSGHGRHVYAVGVNTKKAPHWFNIEFGHWRFNKSAGGKGWRKSKGSKGRGRSAHTLKGALKEPQWVPAHPYLRPTADRISEAVKVMQRALVKNLREFRANNVSSYYSSFSAANRDA